MTTPCFTLTRSRCCLVSGFVRSFSTTSDLMSPSVRRTGSPPVGASLSRSEVQKMLGASSVVSGIVNGLVLVFLLPAAALLADAPKAVLASIVIASVIKKVLMPKAYQVLIRSTNAWFFKIFSKKDHCF